MKQWRKLTWSGRIVGFEQTNPFRIQTNQSHVNLEPFSTFDHPTNTSRKLRKIGIVRAKNSNFSKRVPKIAKKRGTFLSCGKNQRAKLELTRDRVRLREWKKTPKSADPSTGRRRRRIGSSHEHVKRRSLGSVLEQTVFFLPSLVFVFLCFFFSVLRKNSKTQNSLFYLPMPVATSEFIFSPKFL